MAALRQNVSAQRSQFEKPRFPEQRRIDIGFPSPTDQKLMDEFHQTEPEGRYDHSLKFDQPIYREFALRIMLDNFPKHLPAQQLQRLKAENRERLFAVGPVPWLTVPECLEQVEKLLPGTNLQSREILLDYKTCLQRMIRSPKPA